MLIYGISGTFLASMEWVLWQWQAELI